MTGTGTGGLDQLVRAEERLNVTTERVPARRVRLEKYIVTESRTITVEVSREEFRVVDVDPDPDLGVAEAFSAEQDGQPGTGDPERWLTLSEERVIVTTEVVAVERVRLHRSEVTDQQTVTGHVRRERIEREPTISAGSITHDRGTPRGELI